MTNIFHINWLLWNPSLTLERWNVDFSLEIYAQMAPQNCRSLRVHFSQRFANESSLPAKPYNLLKFLRIKSAIEFLHSNEIQKRTHSFWSDKSFRLTFSTHNFPKNDFIQWQNYNKQTNLKRCIEIQFETMAFKWNSPSEWKPFKWFWILYIISHPWIVDPMDL